MMVTVHLRPGYDRCGSCDRQLRHNSGENFSRPWEDLGDLRIGSCSAERRAIFFLRSAAGDQMAGVNECHGDGWFLFGREIRREKLKGP